MSNNRRVLLLCSQLLLTLAARAAGSKTGSISRAPPPPSPFGKQNPWNNTAMEYRALGRSGLRVSALSYGAWLTFTEDGQVGVNKAKQILKECIRQGINFFDNAESYGSFHGESEIIMGEALKQIFEEGRSSRSSSSSDTPSANAKAKDVDVVNIRREELVISTKLFNARGDGVNNKGLSRKHLIEGMRGSLQRLQLDYVDLVYAHRFDPTTPLEETVRAFNFLIDQGMALYWGTSEWTAEEIRRAHQVAEKLNLQGPLMEQPLYNLVARQRVEREYQSLIHSEEGLGLTTYSPLAEGILAGRYLDKGKVAKGSRAEFKKFLLEKESELELARQLKPLAMRLGVSLAQLALAWTLRNQDVSSVIMGASRAEQVIDNVKAVALVAPGGLLTDEVLAQMEKLAASFAPTEDRIKKPISENLAKHRGPYHGGKRRVEL